jgi:hypothetical protein
MNRRVLSDLFAVGHPDDLLHEVLTFCDLAVSSPESYFVTQAYQMALRLYQGQLDGYQSCDTAYHDFAHASETFLAMARLLHGARLALENISPRDFAVGLTAAIFHDAGYIRTTRESSGTGAIYRADHERRSMEFVAQHGAALGLGEQEIEDGQTMIQGTMMAVDVNDLSFRSGAHELLVRMLSAADLLAQLSSATYLERLSCLHGEDRDSRAPRYKNLLDCYHRAIAFDAQARLRLRSHLEQSDAYLAKHFTARWQVPVNLYRMAMDGQIQFLTQAMAGSGFEPQRHLRRWGSLRTEQVRMSHTSGL